MELRISHALVKSSATEPHPHLHVPFIPSQVSCSDRLRGCRWRITLAPESEVRVTVASTRSKTVSFSGLQTACQQSCVTGDLGVAVLLFLRLLALSVWSLGLTTVRWGLASHQWEGRKATESWTVGLPPALRALRDSELPHCWPN